jgi:hypothetical protein
MELLVVCGRVVARKRRKRGFRRGMLLEYVSFRSFFLCLYSPSIPHLLEPELTESTGRTIVSQDRRIEYRCNGIGQVEHFQRQEAQGEGQGRGSGCRSSQATSLDIHSYTIQCVTAI